jgi:XTP/dITP diphosphohydrolase
VKLLLATKNPGKIIEMRLILERLGIGVLSFDDLPEEAPEVVEDGETFLENARKKALEAAKWANMPALADDSGLVVPALGGEPGVRSSRYAGEEGNMVANMDLLLRKMIDIPETDRLAHFVCVLALAAPDGRTWEAGGRVDGLITFDKRGGGGFGYDPVFFYMPADMTFAQMGPEEKNKVSHRSRALAAFAKQWVKIEKELEEILDTAIR